MSGMCLLKLQMDSTEELSDFITIVFSYIFWDGCGKEIPISAIQGEILSPEASSSPTTMITVQLINFLLPWELRYFQVTEFKSLEQKRTLPFQGIKLIPEKSSSSSPIPHACSFKATLSHVFMSHYVKFSKTHSAKIGNVVFHF